MQKKFKINNMQNYKITQREVLPNLNILNRYMEGHNGFIAGGVFKNIFNGQKIRDVDIFFNTEEDFNSALKLFENSDEYIKHYNNDNCHAFKNKNTNVVVELIKKFFMSPQETISNFDFTIVKFAYYKQENEDGGLSYEAIYIDRFFEDLHVNKLVIDDKILLPINTFERSFKYQKYGYGLCRESKIKLIEEIRKIQGDIDVSNSLYNGID